MDHFKIKSGDTYPAFQVGLLSNGEPVPNLDDATEIRMRTRAVEGGPILLNVPMTIVGDPDDAVVEYQWVAGDTDVVGEFYAEFVVTWPVFGPQTFPEEDYCLIEVTPGLDATSRVLPDLPDSCWPVDESACATFADYSVTVRATARAYAGQTLRMLTGYRVGGCPVTVRPCTRSCAAASSFWYSAGWGFMPYIDQYGSWVNSCGCRVDCNHLGTQAITLPGPVGSISQVLVDGEEVPSTAYRVDNGNQLVRLDGEPWPTTQDMTLAGDAVGAFAITYLRGIAVDGLGARVAGLLACEFAKGMMGGKCALPAGVTAITRQGVTMELQTGAFPKGLTGIREVDAFIQRWNPNGLKAPTTVWSPDLWHTRTTPQAGINAGVSPGVVSGGAGVGS